MLERNNDTQLLVRELDTIFRKHYETSRPQVCTISISLYV